MRLKIKAVRKEKKISQEDLAQKSGISPRMLSDYEKPDADIPIKKLQQIADVLDVIIFDLIDPEIYLSPAVVNFLKEPAENKTESLRELINTQKHLIEMQKDKIAELERKLDDRRGKAQKTG